MTWLLLTFIFYRPLAASTTATNPEPFIRLKVLHYHHLLHYRSFYPYTIIPNCKTRSCIKNYDTCLRTSNASQLRYGTILHSGQLLRSTTYIAILHLLHSFITLIPTYKRLRTECQIFRQSKAKYIKTNRKNLHVKIHNSPYKYQLTTFSYLTQHPYS